ncbi:hypothetical protein GXW82_25800 [Streptacidiphilus sp. 4-A2]|nr:hypothetical protein [Streptacidiphilus sp. 4-A2]
MEFPFTMQDFKGTLYDRIRVSPLANMREILIADIYELLPNSAQAESFRQLIQSGVPEIIWVTAQDILQGRMPAGSPAGTHIAPHAKKIL